MHQICIFFKYVFVLTWVIAKKRTLTTQRALWVSTSLWHGTVRKLTWILSRLQEELTIYQCKQSQRMRPQLQRPHSTVRYHYDRWTWPLTSHQWLRARSLYSGIHPMVPQSLINIRCRWVVIVVSHRSREIGMTRTNGSSRNSKLERLIR